jgi:hypothetical protein
MRFARIAGLLALAATFTVVGARAQTSPPGGADTPSSERNRKLSTRDQEFLQDAFSLNSGQALIGDLAAHRATTTNLQKLGEHMRDQAAEQQARLAELARAEGLTLPTQLTSDMQAEVSNLSILYGRAFDDAFLSFTRSREAQDARNFQDHSKNGDDPALRRYAASEVRVLNNQVFRARQVGAASTQPAPSQREQRIDQNGSTNQRDCPPSDQNQHQYRQK